MDTTPTTAERMQTGTSTQGNIANILFNGFACIISSSSILLFQINFRRGKGSIYCSIYRRQSQFHSKTMQIMFCHQVPVKAVHNIRRFSFQFINYYILCLRILYTGYTHRCMYLHVSRYTRTLLITLANKNSVAYDGTSFNNNNAKQPISIYLLIYVGKRCILDARCHVMEHTIYALYVYFL